MPLRGKRDAFERGEMKRCLRGVQGATERGDGEARWRGQKGIYCRSSGRPTVGFFDDLPWVVFGALGRRCSGGGVCTQRKGRNFFGAWSWLFLRSGAGGEELGGRGEGRVFRGKFR